MSELIQTCIIVSLFTALSITCMFLISDKILKRRNSATLFVIYISIKTFFVNILLNICLTTWVKDTVIGQITFYVSLSITAVFTYIIFLYTFDEHFTKIAVVCSFAEVIAMFICNIALVVTNAIGGNPLMYVGAPFKITHLLLPILVFVILFFVLKVGDPVIRFFKRWRVKRTKLLMTAFIVYLLLSMLSFYNEDADLYWELFVVVIIVCVYLLFFYINYFHWKTKTHNIALKKQHKIAKMQYDNLTLQIERVTQAQKDIKAQMQQLLNVSDLENNKAAYIEAYITSLKKQSENIITGIYCDNWFVDSVLCHIAQNCRDRNIIATFYLQGYQHSKIPADVLADFILHLLEFLMVNAKSQLQFKMHLLKGQLILKVSYDTAKKLKLSRELKSFVKKYQGTFDQSFVENTTNIHIILNDRENN